MSADLDTMTAAELRRRIISKDVSPVELTLRALARAEATQATLNAFFVLLPESALAAARAAEDAVMRGQPLGLLHGLPFSAKDLMAVAGVPMRRAPARWPRTLPPPMRPPSSAPGRRRYSHRQDHNQRIWLQAGRR